MTKMLTELFNPAWWLSVVVVGILINIASSYARDYVDKALSKTSTWWRGRSERRTQEWNARIHRLRTDKEFYRAEEKWLQDHRFKAVTWGVWSVFMLICGWMSEGNPKMHIFWVIALHCLALFSFLISHIEARSAQSKRDALWEADKP